MTKIPQSRCNSPADYAAWASLHAGIIDDPGHLHRSPLALLWISFCLILHIFQLCCRWQQSINIWKTLSPFCWQRLGNACPQLWLSVLLLSRCQCAICIIVVKLQLTFDFRLLSLVGCSESDENQKYKLTNRTNAHRFVVSSWLPTFKKLN